MRGQSRKKIELLAPAADLSVACAAIDAGADSVYMGGPAFGARLRAGNSMQDVEKAARYAHRYAARFFLTLNTLVYENEMEDALRIARQAYEAGVDALIIQDMGLIEAGLPPIELHASTQCHITTPEKARFLESVGFRRLVLGRELSVEEIGRIASSVEAEIETFVHGALCVSYSGQCYMSCYMNGRSGNRGACSQACRLAYNLENGRGEILQKEAYLLSMKDFNADPYIEELLDNGVDCLKIEGRLKDEVYVRNVTSYYRRRLDEVLSGRSGWEKASQGMIRSDFPADLQKTYHREYTTFNLGGKRNDWAVFRTPKATGESAGKVLAVEKYRPGVYSGLCLRVKSSASDTVFSPGDGLCYYDREGKLRGGNLERAVRTTSESMWLLFLPGPASDLSLPEKGAVLYRNQNVLFEKKWQTAQVVRKIPVRLQFDTDRFCMTMTDGFGQGVSVSVPPDSIQPARDAESAGATIVRQLVKLGGTAYEAVEAGCTGKSSLFVPVSVLNECRRLLVGKMDQAREERYRPADVRRIESDPPVVYPETEHDFPYRLNVANRYAETFYRRHGIRSMEPAFECQDVQEKMRPGRLLMVCKHCIRFQAGQCLKNGSVDPAYRGDLYLCYRQYKFALHFDCANCRMEVRTCSENTGNCVC